MVHDPLNIHDIEDLKSHNNFEICLKLELGRSTIVRLTKGLWESVNDDKKLLLLRTALRKG